MPSIAWTQDETGRVKTPFEPVLLGATLALIPVFIIETDETPGVWLTAADVANWIIWGVFVAELLFILAVAPRRLAALRAHWLDVALIALTVPLFGQFLSALRFIRLARLLRLLRAVTIVSRAIRAERELSPGTSFRIVALITLFIVVVAGAAEATFDSGDFNNVWDGVWWAVVTVTTVGYGDLYPKTVQGRIIGMVVMLAGIGFLSVLTATVASRFVKVERGDETAEIIAALRRIEDELAEIRPLLQRPGS